MLLAAAEGLRGEPEALLAAGILAILGSFVAAGALLAKPRNQLGTSDYLEAMSLVLLGTSAALAAWRVAYENPIWLLAPALGGLCALWILWRRL